MFEWLYFVGTPTDQTLQREEKFFSRAVTHIVTTRPIPSSPDTEPSAPSLGSSKTTGTLQSQSAQRTINPSLLDRTADPQPLIQPRSGRHALEAASQRRRDAL